MQIGDASRKTRHSITDITAKVAPKSVFGTSLEMAPLEVTMGKELHTDTVVAADQKREKNI